MAVYQACGRLGSTDAELPAVRKRLIELLDSDEGTDCRQPVCGAAANTLARLEPAPSWLPAAGRAFRRHIENANYDEAGAIATAVRWAVKTREFLHWCWAAQSPEVLRQEGGRATAVRCYRNWEQDDEIVAALLEQKDAATRESVLYDLLTQEMVLVHMIEQESGSKAVPRWQRELESVRQWTRQAPDELRKKVEARAREIGLRH